MATPQSTAKRAAIVTGASRGIGRAIAEVLGAEGFGLTLAARKEGPLAETAQQLRQQGCAVLEQRADVADEGDIRALVGRHREHFGRLDVLVNNAGVGSGGSAADQVTKRVDLQLDVNVRAIVLLYRECLPMLRDSGAEHGGALVVNVASMAGTMGQPWLSVYSATKFAVRGYTESMNRELAGEGIKSAAFCPGYVDTAMSEYIKQEISPEEMIKPHDVAEGVRFLLRLSPTCVVPEIVFARPGLII